VSAQVSDIAISPDGKYVAYVTGEVGKMSIHLLKRDNSGDLEIVSSNEAQSKSRFMNLSFAPDGNHLYYLYTTGDTDGIYKVSVLGNSPTKIVEKAYDGLISPDGQTIAFRRDAEDDSEVLMLANADGSNERILIKGQPNWASSIACGAWSPDGKTIACWEY